MSGLGKWLIALVALPVLAQDKADESQFKAQVTNIQVDLTVTLQGKSLLGLTKSDFEIRDEGESRPVLSFAEDSVPLDLVIVIDAGISPPSQKGSKEKNTDYIASLVATAMKQVRPGDRTGVISFSGDPQVEQPMTGDPKASVATAEGIRNTRRDPPGVTVYIPIRALQWAAWMLESDAVSIGFRAHPPGVRRRAVLVIARGGQSGHWYPDEPTIQQYWRSDIALHSVLLPGLVKPAGGSYAFGDAVGPRVGNVAHITRATGGEVIIGDPNDAPEKQIPDLVARIQSRYTMFYAPPAAKSGETRHITVELSEETKKKYSGAVVHSREGYIAK